MRILKASALRSVLVSFAGLLFVGSSINAQPPSKWQRYSAAIDEFSVELPHQPTTISVSRPTRMFEKAKPDGNMYSLYDDGIVYAILSFPNPNRKEPLETFINELKYYPISGKDARFDRQIELDGIVGKQYIFGGQLLSGKIRFYITQNRIHLLHVAGEDINKAGVNKFFSSFSLSIKPSGIEITDTGHLIKSGESVSPGTAEGSPAIALTGRQVTRKAIVVLKPEPSYSDEAKKAQIAGTVVIRAVFSSSGNVTNIRVVSGLPFGLSEQAIIAARNLRFIPAMKDGKYVSMHIQLEYNFNLY